LYKSQKSITFVADKRIMLKIDRHEKNYYAILLVCLR
jgi:hypothetical protein